MDDIDAGTVTLEQDPDGVWIWTWEMPDGSAAMGTAPSADCATRAAERTINEFYARRH